MKQVYLFAALILTSACGKNVFDKRNPSTTSKDSTANKPFAPVALTADQQSCATAFANEIETIWTAGKSFTQTLENVDFQGVQQNQDQVESAKSGLSLTSDPLDCSPLVKTYLEALKNNVNLAMQNLTSGQNNQAVVGQAAANASVDKLTSASSLSLQQAATPGLGNLSVDHTIALIRYGNNIYIDLLGEFMASRIARSWEIVKLVERVSGSGATQSIPTLQLADYKSHIASFKAVLLASMNLDLTKPAIASVGIVAADADEQSVIDLVFSNIIQSIILAQQNHVTADQQLAVTLQAIATNKFSYDLKNGQQANSGNAPSLPALQAEALPTPVVHAALTSLRGATHTALTFLAYTSKLVHRSGKIFIGLAKNAPDKVAVEQISAVSISDLPSSGTVGDDLFSNLSASQNLLIQNAVSQQQNSFTSSVATVAQTVSSLLE